MLGVGTWSAFGTGRTLVGVDTSQTEFSTVEKTGGHKALQQHTHGMQGAGSHSHMVYSSFGRGGTDPGYASTDSVGGGTDNKWRHGDATWVDNHTHTINYTGGGDAGNLQPYITVYMWKRTA